MAAPRLTPEDASLLVHYTRHRSQSLVGKQVHTLLRMQRSENELFDRAEHPAVQTMLETAGFIGPYNVWCTRLDHALITALVERWRVETYTFHLTVGEVSVTLQDVTVLWGLPMIGVRLPGATEWASVDGAAQQLEALCSVEDV